MTTPQMGFEILLLSRMAQSYRSAVLSEIGLDEATASLLRDEAGSGPQDPFEAPAATYEAILGPAVAVGPVERPGSHPFAGSLEYRYVLLLWPHLYWVVRRTPDGRAWGVGFRNQDAIAPARFDPRFVRPGLWTLDALEALADSSNLVDGWNEEVVIHFSFGDQRYDGDFVFGLLQRWQRT